MDRNYFRQKLHLTKKLLDRGSEIWPKFYFAENVFDRKLLFSGHLAEKSFYRKLFLKKGHLTENFLQDRISQFS
jgi:hypothetical protein